MTLDKQLHPQLLLLPHGGELGGAVVDQLVGAAVAGQAGNVDQVVLLVADHVRQEGFDGPEVYHAMMFTLNVRMIFSSGVSNRAFRDTIPGLLTKMET